MTRFKYSGRTRQGDIVKGVVEGRSRDLAALELSDQGITPISIHSSHNIDLGSWFSNSLTSGWRLDDLILVCRQLYSLNKAGIPMLRALNTVIKTQKKPVLLEALKKVVSGLESGLSLSRAMSQSPKVFTPIMVNMVHVGENTGRLDEVFKQLAGYLELEKNTLKELKQTTRYPLTVMIFIIIAVIVVNYMVVPNFASVFDRLGADLPLPTKILIASSDLFVHYWWALLIVLGSAVAFFLNYINSERGRLQWDHAKIKMPAVGGILERVALTRFTRVLAMMMREGVPVLQALNVVSEAVGNRYIHRAVQGMVTRISAGESFTQAAVKSELFTPIVIQMMAVGEASGSLDKLLDEVAVFYESEVEYDLKRFSDWIEPALVVLLAVMALILALGVFLPLWDLVSVSTQMR